MADKNFEILIKLASDLKGASEAISALKGVQGAAGDVGNTDIGLADSFAEIQAEALAVVEACKKLETAAESEKAQATLDAEAAMTKLLAATTKTHAAFDGLNNGVPAGVKKVGAEADQLRGKMDQSAQAIVGAVGPSRAGEVLRFSKTISDAYKATGSLAMGFKALMASLGPVGIALLAINLAMAAYAKITEMVIAAREKFNKSIRDAAKKNIEAEQDYREEINQTGLTTEELAKKRENIARRWSEIQAALKKSDIDDKTAEALRDEAKELASTGKLLKKHGDELIRIRELKLADIIAADNNAMYDHARVIGLATDATRQLRDERKRLADAESELRQEQEKFDGILLLHQAGKATFKELANAQEDLTRSREKFNAIKSTATETEGLVRAQRQQKVEAEILRLRSAGNFARAAELEFSQKIKNEAQALSASLKINMKGEGGALDIVRKKYEYEKEIAAKKISDETDIQNRRAAGDEAGAIALEKEIARRERIKELIAASGMKPEDATKAVDGQIAAENALSKKKISAELEIQRLRDAGDYAGASALERKRNLQAKINELMREGGYSASDAADIAEESFAAADKRLKIEQNLFAIETKLVAAKAKGKTSEAERLKIERDALAVQKEAQQLADRLCVSYKEALKLVRDRKEAEKSDPNAASEGKDARYGKDAKQLKKEQEKIKKDLESDDFKKVEAARKKAAKFEDKYGIGVNDNVQDYKGRDRKTGKLIDAKVGKEAREKDKISKEALDKAEGKDGEADKTDKRKPAETGKVATPGKVVSTGKVVSPKESAKNKAGEKEKSGASKKPSGPTPPKKAVAASSRQKGAEEADAATQDSKTSSDSGGDGGGDLAGIMEKLLAAISSLADAISGQQASSGNPSGGGAPTGPTAGETAILNSLTGLSASANRSQEILNKINNATMQIALKRA